MHCLIGYGGDAVKGDKIQKAGLAYAKNAVFSVHRITECRYMACCIVVTIVYSTLRCYKVLTDVRLTD